MWGEKNVLLLRIPEAPEAPEGVLGWQPTSPPLTLVGWYCSQAPMCFGDFGASGKSEKRACTTRRDRSHRQSTVLAATVMTQPS